jgi:MFS family permease
LCPPRGSAFGLLATVPSIGNLIASSVAGILWTTVSPEVAFIFLAAAMVIAAPLDPHHTPQIRPGPRRRLPERNQKVHDPFRDDPDGP